jgi:predicted N-acetyltransferase YhbS
MTQILYKIGNDVSIDEFVELLKMSTLAERRPIHNQAVMEAMLEHADLIVSAWDGNEIVGIATTLTDFHRVAYLADLAVHADYQRTGIGKELIERTREELEPTCSVILLSAPKANDYYPKIGFEHNPRAWILDSKEKA